MSYVDKWMKSHVGISFATMECAWESYVEISCKEVTYSCMRIALYIQCCIQHKVLVATTTTCPLTLKVV